MHSAPRRSCHTGQLSLIHSYKSQSQESVACWLGRSALVLSSHITGGWNSVLRARKDISMNICNTREQTSVGCKGVAIHLLCPYLQGLHLPQQGEFPNFPSRTWEQWRRVNIKGPQRKSDEMPLQHWDFRHSRGWWLAFSNLSVFCRWGAKEWFIVKRKIGLYERFA